MVRCCSWGGGEPCKIVSELDFLDKQGAAGIEQAARIMSRIISSQELITLQINIFTYSSSTTLTIVLNVLKRLLENTNTKQPQ